MALLIKPIDLQIVPDSKFCIIKRENFDSEKISVITPWDHLNNFDPLEDNWFNEQGHPRSRSSFGSPYSTGLTIIIRTGGIEINCDI